MKAELPKGWLEVSLGEVTAPSRIRVIADEFPTLPYIGLEHVQSHGMTLLGQANATEIKSSCLRFFRGDVLYSRMRPYLNKVWLADFDGLCSAEFLVFPQYPSINSEFLAFRLNSGEFVSFAGEHVSGERPRVDFRSLMNFRFLLPPVAEQGRIVSKLSEMLLGLKRAEDAVTRAQLRLNRYREALLEAALNGELTRAWRAKEPLPTTVDGSSELMLSTLLQEREDRWRKARSTSGHMSIEKHATAKTATPYPTPAPPEIDEAFSLPKGWAWISLDQLAWSSGYGTSAKCSYENHGPAVLRIPNIRNGSIDLSDLKYASEDAQFAETAFVEPGDILVVRTNGSKNLIGRMALVKESLARKCSFASYLIRLRLVGGETLWSWVATVVASRPIRSALESRAATTAGQYNVSLSGLATLAIPLPGEAEQERIVRECERRLAAADELDATLILQLTRATATRASLLREAFAGRLVNQDPLEHPSVLRPLDIESLESTSTKQRSPQMAKPTTRLKIIKRSLMDVLNEAPGPVTPAQLFRDSGYQQEFELSECRQEVVDSFYEELQRCLIPGGKVMETRPDKFTVLLEVKP